MTNDKEADIRHLVSEAGTGTAIGIVGLIVCVAFKTFTHSFGTNAPPTPLGSWTARQAKSMATPDDLNVK